LRKVERVPQVVRLLDVGTVNQQLEAHGVTSIWTGTLQSPVGRPLESSDRTSLLATVTGDVATAAQGCASLNVAYRTMTPHSIVVEEQRGVLTDVEYAKVRSSQQPTCSCQSWADALSCLLLLPCVH